MKNTQLKTRNKDYTILLLHAIQDDSVVDPTRKKFVGSSYSIWVYTQQGSVNQTLATTRTIDCNFTTKECSS